MTRREPNRPSAPRRPRLDVSAYRGEWVAVDPRTYKVQGHGASPEDATRTVSSAQVPKLLLYFVPESDAYFVGSER